MRTYNPPTFNIACRIWLKAFPPSLFNWDGHPPDRPADITTQCQLYLPRGGIGRFLHANPLDAYSSFTESGFQELRVPKGTPLETVWGASFATDFSEAALVECPAWSGRLYLCTMAENKHSGFPNEYRIGILAQLRNPGMARPMAVGVAMSGYVPEVVLTPQLGIGFAGGAVITLPEDTALPFPIGIPPTFFLPVKWFPELAVGTAAVGQVATEQGGVSFGVGIAAVATGDGLLQLPSLGIGVAAANVSPILQTAPTLHAGVACTSTFSLTPVASVGGASCAAATGVAVPSSNRVNLPAGTTKWVKVSINAGTYKVSMTKNSGADSTVFCRFGVCPTPGSWGQLSFPSNLCASSTLAAGTIYLECVGHATLVSDIQVSVATGVC